MEGINIINEYVCHGTTIPSIIPILVLWFSAFAFTIYAICYVFTGRERIKQLAYDLFLYIGLLYFLLI